MGLFEEKKSFSREQLRPAFGKDSGQIPKTGGKKYYEGERKKMVGELFPSKYGGQIDEKDYKKVVKDLKASSLRAPTPEERQDARNKMNYLKRMGGIK
jgi:ribosomal protein RSM22 (predicted rRNA methylase)